LLRALVTNFIFSILAFATLALVVGRDVTPMNEVPARIAAVTPDSAAQRAGLQPNDVIRSVERPTDRKLQCFCKQW
jgi:membrane-associated protease RseP (regulator of RpoE activity)